MIRNQSLVLVLLGSAVGLGLLAIVLNWSSYQSTRRTVTQDVTLWVPGPTADPPSDQATACTGNQAQQANEVIVDRRLGEFSTAAAATDTATMDRVRNEILASSLPRCAHRAQRFVLEWMRAALVQAEAVAGQADDAYIRASKQNADGWYRVMAQEVAALVERDYRNSGRP